MQAAPNRPQRTNSWQTGEQNTLINCAFIS